MKDLITTINRLVTPSGRAENIDLTERILYAIGGGYLLYSAWNGKHAKAIKGSAGALLLYRAFAGQFTPGSVRTKYTSSRTAENVTIQATVHVRKPRTEVYAYWRKLEQLPLFMKHLVSVVQTDEVHSEWTAKIPGLPGSISWKAEIVEEDLNEFLGWASLPGSIIENAGMVEFKDSGSNGTEINATIIYKAPLGKAGEKMAKLFNPVFHRLVKEDLLNFKEIIEIDSKERLFGETTL